MKPWTLILAVAALLHAAAAHAHIQLVYPPQRYAEQKQGPCGRSGGVRGDNVSVFAPGQTITVMWKETVGHPGHFRVSFDEDGDDDFVNPAAYDDFYTNSAVLIDNIKDTGCGDVSQVQVTLPDIECENCTLQVVQVMTDKGPYGDGNDLYYQCSDIALRPGGGADPNPDPALADSVATSCGCQAGGPSSPANALWLAVVFGFLVAGNRRRRKAQGT